MKNILLILFICFALPGFSQNLKVQTKVLPRPYSREVFDVLASDKKNKNGQYVKYFHNGNMAEKGQYEANQKTGIWTYYNMQGEPDQQYNWTTKKLEAAKPISTITNYWVEENNVFLPKEPDELPAFIGGESAFQGSIGSSIRYPVDALRNRKGGEVLISVIINTEGQMIEEQVAKGLGYGLDEESLRVIKSIEGEWVPGKVNGKPVNTKLLIPVRFSVL